MKKQYIARYVCLLSSLFLLSVCHTSFAQINITDSHGKYSFKQPPERVIVLNWALAEQMLELGVTPLGMADINGFTKHASKPLVPNEVIDVGDRLNPNLSKLRELNPQIIIIGYSQRSLLRPLSNIATVIYFKNFGARYNNFEKSRERFTELAKLFDKTELANNKLAQLDTQLADLKSSLMNAHSANNKELPTVQINVTGSGRNTDSWLFGQNSMPYYAATALGLEVIIAPETDQYGVSMVKQKELLELSNQRLNQGTICQFVLTSYGQANLQQADNQIDCVADLSYQNAFGGTMSVLYLAESIHAALINKLD